MAKPHISVGAESLLGQEIERFNQQSEDEKFGRSSPHGPANFRERLRQVSSIQAYDDLMNEMRTRDQALFERHRPLLFKLTPPLAFVDESDTIPTVNAPYGVRMNRNYFTSTDFESRRQSPSVAFRDGIAGTFMVTGGGAEIRKSRSSTGPVGASGKFVTEDPGQVSNWVESYADGAVPRTGQAKKRTNSWSQGNPREP